MYHIHGAHCHDCSTQSTDNCMKIKESLYGKIVFSVQIIHVYPHIKHHLKRDKHIYAIIYQYISLFFYICRKLKHFLTGDTFERVSKTETIWLLGPDQTGLEIDINKTASISYGRSHFAKIFTLIYGHENNPEWLRFHNLF